jgi:hypothetical protein
MREGSRRWIKKVSIVDEDSYRLALAPPNDRIGDFAQQLEQVGA